MPTERWIGVVSKVIAICGSAVVITVLSRFSMNSAVATISGTIMERAIGSFISGASIGCGGVGRLSRAAAEPMATDLGTRIGREPHIEDHARERDQRHGHEHGTDVDDRDF